MVAILCDAGQDGNPGAPGNDGVRISRLNLIFISIDVYFRPQETQIRVFRFDFSRYNAILLNILHYFKWKIPSDFAVLRPKGPPVRNLNFASKYNFINFREAQETQ